MQHLPDALYLRVTSSLIPMSLDSHSIHIGSCKHLLKLNRSAAADQQGFAGCYYYGYRFPSDMVLFDFNQESVDTTFVDESLIDDAPVVAPPMPLPPVVEEKLNK